MDLTYWWQILQLGWHAHEQKMPDGIAKLLTERPLDEVTGLVAEIATQLKFDDDVVKAYMAHEDISFFGKVKGEGANFCGYHNIQMLLSYLRAIDTTGRFNGDLPDVLHLQDIIEQAWDAGINAAGRDQTGGIKGTRKHIGTMEAQAVFEMLVLSCPVKAYQDTKDSQAWRQLLEDVWHYYSSVSRSGRPSTSSAHESISNELAATRSNDQKVVNTTLPPIYLQRPRHSMTIVGIEKLKDGTLRLLVLDPGVDLFEKKGKGLLKAARRGKRQLMPHRAFETLRVSGTHLGEESRSWLEL